MSQKVISYTLKYNFKNKLNKDGTAPIHYYLNKDGQNRYRNTGINVLPQQWNDTKKTIVKHPLAEKLNSTLFDFKKMLVDKEKNLRDKYGNCSVMELIAELDKIQDSRNFYEFAITEMNKQKLSIDRKNKLVQFLNEFKEFTNDIAINNIDFSTANDYINHLRNKPYKGRIGNKDNYIIKKKQPLVKYFELAIKKGLVPNNNNPFNDVKIKSQRTDRKALSMEEIAEIENLTFQKSKRNHELIRDMFLFQFYTGMAFIDASKLTKSDITESKEGLLIDNSNRQKTSKAMYIPLHALFPVKNKKSKPEQILLKYWNTKQQTFFALPNGSDDKANNQYVNRILQTKIIPLTKIKKHVTTHVARHSFATYMIWKMPVPVVGQLLQHSDIKTTMIYVHVNPENVVRELKKIDNWT